MLRALIVLASAIAMEGVAALVHRLWMHGPGWGWHRSHHEPGPARIERNDAYAVVFAAIAVVLFVVGQGPWWPLYWVAAGMTLYGLLYGLVHDGLVHRRWPLRWSPRRGGYLARLVQAHRLHHAVGTREGAVSFGFLFARDPSRLAAELRARRRGRGAST
ncbi:MAG: sterol desaturase family protein [Aquincola tertiaricarbonis]